MNRAFDRPNKLAWVLVIGVPALLAVVLIRDSLRDDLIGELVRRQFRDCYVGLPVFVIYVLLTVISFLISSRIGVNTVKLFGDHPRRILVFVCILAILGTFFLQTGMLSHAGYWWSLSKRIAVAAMNFGKATVICGIFGAIFLLRKVMINDLRSRTLSLLPIVLWGYLVASGFRMLPFLVGIE